MNIEAVIFDLFGTLMYISKETKPYSRLLATGGFTGIGQIHAARHICLTENLPTMAAVGKRLWPGKQIDTSCYDDEVQKEIASCTLYPETLDVLSQLVQMNMKIGLISNLATPYKEPFFSLGLSAFIPLPVFSCDEGTLKPEKKIYNLALTKMGVLPEKAIMVGDKVGNDVEGPSFIGLRGILLDRAGSSDYPMKISTLRDIIIANHINNWNFVPFKM